MSLMFKEVSMKKYNIDNDLKDILSYALGNLTCDNDKDYVGSKIIEIGRFTEDLISFLYNPSNPHNQINFIISTYY